MGLRKEKGVRKGSIGKPKESGLAYQLYHNRASSETRHDYGGQSLQPVTKISQHAQDSAQEYEYTQNSLRVKHLTAELAKKTNDFERLRSYVAELEEGEKGLIQELTRQLSLKDREIGRLALLYAKKEEENRKVSQAFESHIFSQKEHAQRIKDLLVKKEEENTAQIERLRKELESKEVQVQSLRQGLLSSSKHTSTVIQDTTVYTRQIGELHGRIDNKENEIKKLEKTLLEEQKTGKAIQSKLMERIAETSKQTEQLKIFMIDKERVIKSLQSEFEKAGGSDSKAIHGRNSQALQPAANKIEELRKDIEERDRLLQRIEKAYSEEQKLHKSVQSRLREQISEMSSSIEQLKSILIEKEKLVHNLESAFEKRFAAKEDEARQFKATLSKKHETGIYVEIDKLKSEVKVKEETTKLMAQEIAKQAEQTAMLRKRLEERQRVFVESERAYEELIARLRGEHDSRIKAIVQASAQKEAALAGALEEERSKLRQEKTILKEKEMQIEEALRTFATTSQQLIKLGGTSGLMEESTAEISAFREHLDESRKQIEDKERYVAQKETEVRSMLASIEARIAELNEKEASVEIREKLLMKEQDALALELEVLSNAGIELSKSKEYLRGKMSAARSAEKQQMAPEREQIIGLPRFRTETAVEEAPLEEAEEM